MKAMTATQRALWLLEFVVLVTGLVLVFLGSLFLMSTGL